MCRSVYTETAFRTAAWIAFSTYLGSFALILRAPHNVIATTVAIGLLTRPLVTVQAKRADMVQSGRSTSPEPLTWLEVCAMRCCDLL